MCFLLRLDPLITQNILVIGSLNKSKFDSKDWRAKMCLGTYANIVLKPKHVAGWWDSGNKVSRRSPRTQTASKSNIRFGLVAYACVWFRYTRVRASAWGYQGGHVALAPLLEFQSATSRADSTFRWSSRTTMENNLRKDHYQPNHLVSLSRRADHVCCSRAPGLIGGKVMVTRNKHHPP